MQSVEIRDRTALPMREISALALRWSSTQGTELLAVGDEDFAVVRAELTSSDRIERTWRDDLCRALSKAGVDMTSGSGFEGVACDGDGNVLVLQEEASVLHAFAPDVGALLGTVALVVQPEAPGYGEQWHADPNSRAEGLLLLKSGHVLCAKQKDPVRLIEFGPADHSPLGVAADTVLPPDARFELTGGSNLVPLADWELSEGAEEDFPTLNDIAFGDDDRIYLISAKGRAIGRLEKRLEPGERARMSDWWSIQGELPGGDDARPEGLTIVPDRIPIIGIDSKLAGDNVFVLSSLD